MTSFVNGGPHKSHYATKPQGQWITKTRSSLIIDTRTFHHIIDTTFHIPPTRDEGIEVRFLNGSLTFYISTDY